MNQEKKEFLVDGFLFQDEELAQMAKKEAGGIRYIKDKTSMDDPEMVLQIYNKIIEQKMFETQVGISYLKELQEYLQTMPAIRKEEIKPIPVEEIIRKEFVTVKEQDDKVKKVSDGKTRVSRGLNVVLVLIIIAMFIITLTSDHPNILNYEEKLLDRYAGWEQELEEREKQVREKEAELGLN